MEEVRLEVEKLAWATASPVLLSREEVRLEIEKLAWAMRIKTGQGKKH